MAIYLVLVNHEGQYSLWPAFLDVPLGWTPTGPRGERQACLSWIDEHWTDMRPASLVRQMEGTRARGKGRGTPDPAVTAEISLAGGLDQAGREFTDRQEPMKRFAESLDGPQRPDAYGVLVWTARRPGQDGAAQPLSATDRGAARGIDPRVGAARFRPGTAPEPRRRAAAPPASARSPPSHRVPDLRSRLRAALQARTPGRGHAAQLSRALPESRERAADRSSAVRRGRHRADADPRRGRPLQVQPPAHGLASGLVVES